MRVLLISDVHGNADALKAILENSGRWDYLWILGDLVDYGPEPHVVVDLIKSMKPDLVISGNHDYAVAYGVDCKCAQDLHELSVYTRFNISMKLLSREQISWLKTLPHKIELKISGKRVYVVHGSPRSPLYGYLKPNLSYDELIQQLTPQPLGAKPVEADVVITGHTHIPLNMRIGNIWLLNPGSCGQPRDGDPRASYAVLDIENNLYEQRRIKYDIDKVLLKLRNLNIEQIYFEWLKVILKQGRVFEKVDIILGKDQFND
ncbi:MAG: metallophosphoesterase family protein [Desulfurococcaceae archaeon]